jgi:hypothetical protein
MCFTIEGRSGQYFRKRSKCHDIIKWIWTVIGSPAHHVSKMCKIQTTRSGHKKQTGTPISLFNTPHIVVRPGTKPRPNGVKFPCGVSGKTVKWTTPGTCCDTCDVWYHQSCMGMSDAVYGGLGTTSWECFNCGVPNITSHIFDATIFSTSNSFNILSDDNTTDTPTTPTYISFTSPNATSSPQKLPVRGNVHGIGDIPLRIVVQNCRSVRPG